MRWRADQSRESAAQIGGRVAGDIKRPKRREQSEEHEARDGERHVEAEEATSQVTAGAAKRRIERTGYRLCTDDVGVSIASLTSFACGRHSL